MDNLQSCKITGEFSMAARQILDQRCGYKVSLVSRLHTYNYSVKKYYAVH